MTPPAPPAPATGIIAWVKARLGLVSMVVVALSLIAMSAVLAVQGVVGGANSFAMVMAVLSATGGAAFLTLAIPTIPNSNLLVHLVISLAVLCVVSWLAALHIYTEGNVLTTFALFVPAVSIATGVAVSMNLMGGRAAPRRALYPVGGQAPPDAAE